MIYNIGLIAHLTPIAPLSASSSEIMDDGPVACGDFGVATFALLPALAPLLRSAILTLLYSG